MCQLRSFSDLQWVSQSMVNRACAGHTVNGRTLIATLMEEAPSVAAMTVSAGYVFVGMGAMTTWIPKFFDESKKADHSS